MERRCNFDVMIKNYPIIPYLFRFQWFWLILLLNIVQAQEPKIFTTADFDLKGKVKRCLVITDYGRETYDFSRDGLLTKVTTVYSESDYDITYYKYSKGLLKEKRLENYREDNLDRQTSLAHLYNIDTLINKIVKLSCIIAFRQFNPKQNTTRKKSSLKKLIQFIILL